MESFRKKNEVGVECNYYVVATTNEDGKEYVIYTDFVPEGKGEMRLFAGLKEGEEVLSIAEDTEKRLIREFKTEMDKNKRKKNEDLSYDDLSFSTIGPDGEEVLNDITRVVPNRMNSNEPYVVFTDYSLDLNDEFISHYGRLVEENGNFMIETKLSEEEVKYIEEMLQDEVVQYVNDTIEESLNE